MIQTNYQTITKKLQNIYEKLMYIYSFSHYLDKKQAEYLKIIFNEKNENFDFYLSNNKEIWIKKADLQFPLHIFEKSIYNSIETCETEIYEHNTSTEIFNKRHFTFKNSKIYTRLVSIQTFFFSKEEKELLVEQLNQTNILLDKINTIINWNRLYTRDVEYEPSEYKKLNEDMLNQNIDHSLTVSYQMICNLDNSQKRKVFEKMMKFQGDIINSIEPHEIDFVLNKIQMIHNEKKPHRSLKDDYISGIEKSKDIYIQVLNPVLLNKKLNSSLKQKDNLINKIKL